MKEINELDHMMTDEMVCPHCGEEQSDSWETALSKDSGEAECDHCGKTFKWEEITTIQYTTRKQ